MAGNKLSKKIVNAGEKTYKKTVASGFYDKYRGGLYGKFDNVRIYWEDQTTKNALRPYLKKCLARDKGKRGLRILDLGCGSGQGYELLSKIDRSDAGLDLKASFVLPPECISIYLGVDISEEMLKKGRKNYAGKSNISFRKMDLRRGLDESIVGKRPFDIYFSSYAALSHLEYDQVRNLVLEIAEHAAPNSLLVLDFLGRFSIEWPGYWNARSESEKVMLYSMSYLYTDGILSEEEPEKFPVRFWTGDEIPILCEQVYNETHIKINPHYVFDKSILIGRHVDTREYNRNVKPVRRMVNRLHEDYMRTDLESLIIGRVPQSSIEVLNNFYKKTIFSWDTIIKFTRLRLKKRLYPTEMKGWGKFDSSLQKGLMYMDRVIDSVLWMSIGDPRANIIEPQLSYTLRDLLNSLQCGLGCGHGLVAILEIKKKK